MSKHKLTNAVCGVIVALTLAFTVFLMSASATAGESTPQTMGYEDKIFDDSYVHTIDIQMDADEWDYFIQNATDEEYAVCTLVIDGESFPNVGLRAKGNTSLSNVAAYGNNRYSFKAEFDHYNEGETYYGLDKLVLNNNIQDNTLMKDYLTYKMMASLGVASPLVSYVWVTINGEDWGLYLALESIEQSFLERNYGSDYGDLYKPDSTSMGGGRGNGKDFNMDDFADLNGIDFSNLPGVSGTDDASGTQDASGGGSGQGNPPQGDSTGENAFPQGTFTPNGQGGFSDGNQQNGGPGGGSFPQGTFTPGDGSFPNGSNVQVGPNADGQNGFTGGGMQTSSDVSLIYTDDDPDSYSNIFDSAKTVVSRADEYRLIASLKRLNEGTDIEDTVDVDSVIRYFAAHNFVDNFDSYTGSMIHNYYLYEKDGVLSMIPWDYNLAFGGFQGASDATALVNYPIDTPVSNGTVDSRPMLAWIFNSDEYTALYHQVFSEFLSDFFDSGEFESLFDSTVALISPYVERDTNGFCTYDEFLTGTATLREFCLLRAESIKGQLDGSIPSTSDGQSADSSSLIDASDLSVSSMGSMSGMGDVAGMLENKNNTQGRSGPDSTDGTTTGQPGQNDAGAAQNPSGSAAPSVQETP